MTHIIHRYPKTDLPSAVRGDGIHLFDASGKQYIDACGGAAISCLGHSHKAVIEAIKSQADELPFAHTGFFTNEPLEQLGDRLADLAPGDLNNVQILCGGSEAVEAAVKLARQHVVDRGEPGRVNIISRRRSYHGATMATLAIGENIGRKAPFLPLLINAEQIAPCYSYRHQQPHESSFDYGQRAANELATVIERMGADTVAAFVMEPVVGATLGAVASEPGYLKRIREICDQYGVLLVFDEVMCGTGRTGTLFACAQETVVPDILVMAKGLAAGYQPIGAILARDHVMAPILETSGAFIHGHSFMGHPVACRAALAVLDAFEAENLMQNVTARGTQLKAALHQRLDSHPHIGDIRGRGLFVGIEFVEDRLTKQPFDAHLRKSAQFKSAAMELGLLCYPGSGTADGTVGDHVLVAPPYIITAEQIELIADKVAEAAALVFDQTQTRHQFANVS